MIGKNKRLIYSRDASGASALHKAAKDGHIEVVKAFIAAGVDKEAKTIGGDAALHSPVRSPVRLFWFPREGWGLGI